MEYNENKNFEEGGTSFEEEAVILREKEPENKNIWYWIIAILGLVLIIWYGYTAGWFTTQNPSITELNNEKQENSYPVDDTLAPIDNMVIVSGDGFPVEKTLSLKGNLSDGCTYLNEPQVIRDGNTFYVNLTTYKEGDTCTEALVPYERNIGLDVIGLPAGVYNVIVNRKQTTFELEQDNNLDFAAGENK